MLAVRTAQARGYSDGVYLDENGWVVKHWKDGTIEKIQKANLK